MDTVHMTGRLDPRSGWRATGCTIAKALELMSTKSSFLLLREAFYGTTRFDEFAERVGISEPVAAARLRELVDHGLLAREDYREPGQRTRHEYLLTPSGADLVPTLVALAAWGAEHLPHQPSPSYAHAGCGAPVSARIACDAGHAVTMDELVASA
jgi:DNA-binding HxlR family transcriptional regulator